MHKSLNVLLVLVTLALSIASSVLVSKDARQLAQLDKLIGFNLDNNVGMLYQITIALSVTSGLLLLMAVGALKINAKWFGMLKLVLCVATLVLAIMAITYGAKIMNDPLLNPDLVYGKTSVAAGVFGILAVGSCTFTALKMLMK